MSFILGVLKKRWGNERIASLGGIYIYIYVYIFVDNKNLVFKKKIRIAVLCSLLFSPGVEGLSKMYVKL